MHWPYSVSVGACFWWHETPVRTCRVLGFGGTMMDKAQSGTWWVTDRGIDCESRIAVAEQDPDRGPHSSRGPSVFHRAGRLHCRQFRWWFCEKSQNSMILIFIFKVVAARQSPKVLAYPPNNPVKQGQPWRPLCKWGNWGWVKLSPLARVPQGGNSHPRTQPCVHPVALGLWNPRERCVDLATFYFLPNSVF